MAAAAAGFYVILEDVMPAKLRKAELEYTDLSKQGGFGELQLASTVEEAVREADIAVDFVPDELESKLEIFSMMDRMAPPKTILLTPTESQSISDLASCVYRPERCVALRGEAVAGGQVRLLYASKTALETVERTGAFLARLGMTVFRRPIPTRQRLQKQRNQPD